GHDRVQEGMNRAHTGQELGVVHICQRLEEEHQCLTLEASESRQLPTPAQFAKFTVREKLQCGTGIDAGDDLASPFNPAGPGVNEDRRSRFPAAPVSRRAKAWAVGDSVRRYL